MNNRYVIKSFVLIFCSKSKVTKNNNFLDCRQKSVKILAASISRELHIFLSKIE